MTTTTTTPDPRDVQEVTDCGGEPIAYYLRGHDADQWILARHVSGLISESAEDLIGEIAREWWRETPCECGDHGSHLRRADPADPGAFPVTAWHADGDAWLDKDPAPAPLPAQGDATDLDALETLAKAATPGPWEYRVHEDDERSVEPNVLWLGPPDESEDRRNTDFIAAANPKVVLALITELRALRAAPAPVEGDATDRLPPEIVKALDEYEEAIRGNDWRGRTPGAARADLDTVLRRALRSPSQPQPDGEVRRALEVLATNLENPAADRAWCARTLRSLSAAPAPRHPPGWAEEMAKEADRLYAAAAGEDRANDDGGPPPPDASVAAAPAKGKETRCDNNSPPWFTGRWRDWHRGHGCEKDDGKPRTPEGAAEIASGPSSSEPGSDR